MMNVNWARFFGWLAGGMLIAFVAVFLGLMSAVAPVLSILLSVLIVLLAILAGSYGWARHVASGNGQLAFYVFLFWVWVVNMPAIVAFDTSGITKADLFNPQSIGRIAMFFLVGAGFVVNYFNTGHRPMRPLPRVGKAFAFPIVIFAWYVIDAFMILGGQDLLLALYRISEWGLLLFLIAAVARRAPTEARARETWFLRLVFALLVFSLVIPLILFPIAPSRVYFVGENGVGRLGSPFAHPNVLGVLAAMAFFYLLERKPRFFRLGLALSFGIMLASYSRGAWAGFALATAFYLVLRPRTMQGRFFVVLAMVFAAAFGWAAQGLFIKSVEQVLARGGTVADLKSASERTEVWRASEILIKQAPILGHGYIAGPKKLNDIMATGRSASYFRAVHAHNEFVQTQIDGGILATLLLIAFVLRSVYLLRALARLASAEFFRCVTAWFILIWTYGMLTPNISGQVMILGALLLYLYVVMELHYLKLRANAATRAVLSFGNEQGSMAAVVGGVP